MATVRYLVVDVEAAARFYTERQALAEDPSGNPVELFAPAR